MMQQKKKREKNMRERKERKKIRNKLKKQIKMKFSRHTHISPGGERREGKKESIKTNKTLILDFAVTIVYLLLMLCILCHDPRKIPPPIHNKPSNLSCLLARTLSRITGAACSRQPSDFLGRRGRFSFEKHGTDKAILKLLYN
jgi:hypothetical protein